nr:tyrosine-type recombinase/integrase [Parabacteroides leei]
MSLDEVKKILTVMYKGLINNQHTNNYMYKAQTRNIAIVEVLFSIGMRVSEVCNLNYEDINLRNGVIRVFGKGSKERIIQICQSETLSIIRTYYQSYKQEIGYSLPIFINRLGQRVSTQSVRLMIKSYVKKAGLSKRITPHLARHTFATLLLEEDVAIEYIQDMLGHSSIAITQIYTHVNISKQKKILTTKHPRRKLQLAANG